jgi:hypothetical protein
VNYEEGATTSEEQTSDDGAKKVVAGVETGKGEIECPEDGQSKGHEDDGACEAVQGRCSGTAVAPVRGKMGGGRGRGRSLRDVTQQAQGLVSGLGASGKEKPAGEVIAGLPQILEEVALYLDVSESNTPLKKVQQAQGVKSMPKKRQRKASQDTAPSRRGSGEEGGEKPRKRLKKAAQVDTVNGGQNGDKKGARSCSNATRHLVFMNPDHCRAGGRSAVTVDSKPRMLVLQCS